MAETAVTLTRLEEVAVQLAHRLNYIGKATDVHTVVWRCGTNWELSEKYNNQWQRAVQDEHGHIITLSQAYRGNGRISIGGTYLELPSKFYGTKESPSITVAGDRPNNALLVDITKRFLPDYFELWNDVKKKLDEQNAAKGNRRRVTEELAALTGGGARIYGIEERDADPYIHFPIKDGFYGDVKVNWGGTEAEVSLKGVSIDVVKRILAVLPVTKSEEQGD